ncbi:MAG: DUF6873 family GME fold protein [Clostridia bacterium]|nr:hypothetical protein [Clostridiales bacterium]
MPQRLGDEKRVKAVIVDGRAASLAKNRIKAMGIEVIRTVKHPRLYETVAFHPDMVICPVGEGRMVVEPLMYEYFKKALMSYRVELLKGESELSRNYPSNIAYNIATVGSKAFLYSRHADRTVVKELKKRAVDFINVKQGYTKCSTAVVDDNSIITADHGIYDGALRNGVDALLIEPGHIVLEGFDYGFIGGCCGRIGSSLLAFAGDPSTHPDWAAISVFLKKRGVIAVSLFEGPLMDVGTIIPVLEIC